MSKKSEAKKKRREKRLEFRAMEENINQTLSVMSSGMQKITNKLKETDLEFAAAHDVFENLKDKYLLEKDGAEEQDSKNCEERERFEKASEVVFKKTL